MDRNCRIWNKCKLLPIGGDARVLERLSYCVELIVGSGNNILLLLSCQLLRARFQGDFKKTVFLDGTPGNGDSPLFVEHVGNAAAAGEVAMVAGKDAADFGRRAVLVVGRRFDDHCHTAGRITFVDDLVEMLRFCSLTRPALDGAIDVVVRPALGTGGKDGAAQARVPVRIPAAGLGRDGDLAGELAEKRPAFRIDCALEALNLRPLAVSRHEMGIPVKLPDRPAFFREPESLEGETLSRRQINEGN